MGVYVRVGPKYPWLVVEATNRPVLRVRQCKPGSCVAQQVWHDKDPSQS